MKNHLSYLSLLSTKAYLPHNAYKLRALLMAEPSFSLQTIFSLELIFIQAKQKGLHFDM
jgi:hypothetical protein